MKNSTLFWYKIRANRYKEIKQQWAKVDTFLFSPENIK